VEVLKGLARDPKVRAALVALVLAIAAYFGVGCESFGGAAPHLERGIAIADCQLEAVRKLVPHVATADAFVAAARGGDYERAVALLLELGLSVPEVQAVAMAFDACRGPQAAAAAPEPGQLEAL
jgi:hypothetical protein